MKVSIIVTCFNRERFIGRAIRSALAQNFSEFEVIVVDDGSTDSSPAIIKDFGDKIHAVFHQENLGLPSARNTGIRKALGRFVVHLDSDDYIHHKLLEVEYMHLAMNPRWGAVECDYVEVNENERHLHRHDARENPIACGIMFRKDLLVDIGLYDEKMLCCEDEELRRRFVKNHHIGHICLPLYRYTRHRSNLTNDQASMEFYRAKIETEECEPAQ